ncbi:hypothetical protein [Clostridium sp.]|uniref:XkdQ/YqbQ family protein n=1 Tax=Clostridium sp. TaxID=1506 RepID=UPI002627B054|nr:hypothetical protein [Clostridium sp.]
MARELTYDEYIALILSGRFSPSLQIDMIRPTDGSVYNSFSKYPLIGSTLTIDCSNSTGCRRSVNLILDNSDEFFLPDPNNGVLWMNTMFKLYVGVLDNQGNYKYFPQGVFVCSNSKPEVVSDLSEGYRVNLKASDKWQLLSQNTLGAIYQIPAQTSVTSAINSILPLCWDYTVPVIQEVTDKTPYNMAWNATYNYGTIIRDLANLYMRECYYNEGGNLVFKEFTDINKLETIWNFTKNDISYMGGTRVLEFDNVYNQVIIIANNSNTNAIYRGVATNTDLTSSTRVGFIPPKTYTEQNDNLWSNDLCQQYAQQLLTQYQRVQESITMKALPLPHVDVNKAITITDTNLGLYMSRFAIQKVQLPIDMQSEMSLTCLKYSDGSDFENRMTINATNAK